MTVMINYVYISLSAVQINDLSYFHLPRVSFSVQFFFFVIRTNRKMTEKPLVSYFVLEIKTSPSFLGLCFQDIYLFITSSVVFESTRYS